MLDFPLKRDIICAIKWSGGGEEKNMKCREAIKKLLEVQKKQTETLIDFKKPNWNFKQTRSGKSKWTSWKAKRENWIFKLSNRSTWKTRWIMHYTKYRIH